MYGSPQAIAWNIGTTGITESASRTSIESGRAAPSVWRTIDRCEYRTPFGRPVVPLV